MIAVSNTTPLRYLVAIEQDHLFGQLFEKVFIPTGVFDELTEAKTPDRVRRRILAPPAWLQVSAVRETPAIAFPVALHRGERESILLAEIIRADVLLIDERAGRSIASSRNLPISGTLGVLERADTQGLVSDFSETLERLKASGFYIGDVLEKQLLQRHLGRRQGK
jgi:predicted nucleic acid-binding protein